MSKDKLCWKGRVANTTLRCNWSMNGDQHWCNSRKLHGKANMWCLLRSTQYCMHYMYFVSSRSMNCMTNHSTFQLQGHNKIQYNWNGKGNYHRRHTMGNGLANPLDTYQDLRLLYLRANRSNYRLLE